MMQRRKFVTGAGSLLIAAGFVPATFAKAADGIDFRAVEFASGFKRSKLEALLHETFYIHSDSDGVVSVRLVGLEERQSRAKRIHRLRAARVEQFSAVFQGPALPVLSAGLYPIEHWLAGQALLNLEPVEGCCYRADFAVIS